jgi:hypothetical protein
MRAAIADAAATAADLAWSAGDLCDRYGAGAFLQGLTLVHIPDELKHLLWKRRVIQCFSDQQRLRLI